VARAEELNLAIVGARARAGRPEGRVVAAALGLHGAPAAGVQREALVVAAAARRKDVAEERDLLDPERVALALVRGERGVIASD
jgi:hypothetical protein